MQPYIAPITSTTKVDTEKRIKKLRQMLHLNQISQQKLLILKTTIEKRKIELEQVGLIQCLPSTTSINLFTERYNYTEVFDELHPVQTIKKMPAQLEDQLLIKNNSQAQYQFIKNLNNQNDNDEEQDQKYVRKEEQQQYSYNNRQVQEIYTNQRHIPRARRAQNTSVISTLHKQAIPNKIDFTKQAKKKSKYQNAKVLGIDLYKQWRKFHKKDDGQKIKELNEVRLQEKKKIYGDNWEKIGYFFNGFKFQQLYYYYQRNLNKRQKGKWTLRLNLILIALIDYYGSGKWVLISKKMKQKTQYQIRQRFCNILSPEIKEIVWTPDETKLLLQIAKSKQYRYKWSKIIKQVPTFRNKTDNALRRKFRNLMIKKTDQQIEKEIDCIKLRESILKFKRQYYNRGVKKKMERVNSLALQQGNIKQYIIQQQINQNLHQNNIKQGLQKQLKQQQIKDLKNHEQQNYISAQEQLSQCEGDSLAEDQYIFSKADQKHTKKKQNQFIKKNQERSIKTHKICKNQSKVKKRDRNINNETNHSKISPKNKNTIRDKKENSRQGPGNFNKKVSAAEKSESIKTRNESTFTTDRYNKRYVDGNILYDDIDINLENGSPKFNINILSNVNQKKQEEQIDNMHDIYQKKQGQKGNKNFNEAIQRLEEYGFKEEEEEEEV